MKSRTIAWIIPLLLMGLGGDGVFARQQEDDLSAVEKEVWILQEEYWAALGQNDLVTWSLFLGVELVPWEDHEELSENYRHSVEQRTRRVLSQLKPGTLEYQLTDRFVRVYGDFATVQYSCQWAAISKRQNEHNQLKSAASPR